MKVFGSGCLSLDLHFKNTKKSEMFFRLVETRIF